jgi:hypothetical protein
MSGTSAREMNITVTIWPAQNIANVARDPIRRSQK